MTRVAIFPIPIESGEMTYHALAGDKRSHGRTAGEALDSLTSQLEEEKAGTVVIIQHHRPDVFFDKTKQQRLTELMARWRSARDSGDSLPAEEQAELDSLIEEEIRASALRTNALVREIAC